MTLCAVRFDSPEAAPLLADADADADAYNLSLYGHADQSSIDPREFTPARRGLFIIALLHGHPVGCGGIRESEPPAPAGSAEVKRMFVIERGRRRGTARTILAALEHEARQLGYQQIILDVGSKQSAAHQLYEHQGYTRIPGFTIYRAKPGNRAYGKMLWPWDGLRGAATRR
jgi:GNAT superfamily N-acetyltransferase